MHAERCIEMAAEAKTGLLNKHFLTLSETWENLAAELERTESLMDEVMPGRKGQIFMPGARASRRDQ